jgi:hypothetical protein
MALISLGNQSLVQRVSDSPAFNEADLNGPNKDALIEGEIRKQAALNGTDPGAVDNGINQIKANNAQMIQNDPLLYANAVRDAELRNNPDYLIASNDTPNQTAQDAERANSTYAFMTANETDPDDIAFWARSRDTDLAQVAQREQGYVAYSSDPARVSNVAQIEAERQALSAQNTTLRAPEANTRQVLNDLGVGNVRVNVNATESIFQGVGLNGAVYNDVPYTTQDSLGNLAQRLGRPGYDAPSRRSASF